MTIRNAIHLGTINFKTILCQSIESMNTTINSRNKRGPRFDPCGTRPDTRIFRGELSKRSLTFQRINRRKVYFYVMSYFISFYTILLGIHCKIQPMENQESRIKVRISDGISNCSSELLK